MGNGIVERCHHTVKVIATRKSCSVAEAVYFHNLIPQDDHTSSSTPANIMDRYFTGVHGVDHSCEEDEPEVDSFYQAGDKVWIKLPNVRCDGRHRRGIVTRVVSDQAVEVDRVPHHIRDLHRCTSQES